MAQYKGAASEAGRAMQIKKRREREQEELEQKKRKLEETLKINKIENKFAVHYDAVEQQLKSSTIGLVTLNEMKAKQEDVVKEREKELARKQREKEKQKKREIEAKNAEKKQQKEKIAKLSFNLEDDAEEESDEEDISSGENEDSKEKEILKMAKNPDVDTSFLPDRQREEEDNKLREELRLEWESKQEAIKLEEIEITFSYWDGSGHRRSVRMKKGNTIYQFLQKTLDLLRKEFNELRCVTADNLMYIKEDLIIPHHNTFYDFIVNKARGKSGPLFHFDVRDDVRLTSDASVRERGIPRR
ncbi:Protein FAM50-like protein [Armadillidium nasatum]|uniref:Protein FAM50 homolog n=1 Tax=Armadillidium nasatum TaxID=96803 RepID=A0A5N5SNN9_9CRUS|nr:Protein FAM50-like protein [Armadillidium nasatum]